MIRKILVANRGEIALRIMRAAEELSIPTVSVYSEADKQALHVRRSREAVLLGPPPATESYLVIDKIITAARETGCDAVHPGYGFLAENPEFSKAVRDAGLVFIGPTPEATRALGNKLEARAMMMKAKVPIVPGAEIKSRSIEEFMKEAKKIGYPVLIKAAAGGGGKGMRIVEDELHLKESVEAARRESKGAFGDETVYLEKFLKKPRHIEFQILADSQGNVVHLFERECSIQRRHQKIIEETPSMALTTELRRKMGEAAVAAAKAAKYLSAGTVEFLYEDGEYYFLEVNARIQVEHPVTEFLTGIDLVKEQVKIASGEPISFKQEELRPRGHATECRIYAEDPENSFLPSAGKVLYLEEPAGANLRVDSGIYSGCEVPIFYDPILSKVITYGRDREESIDRMILALKQYRVVGIKTNVAFLIDCLKHPEYRKGNLFTGFIDQYLPDWQERHEQRELELAIAGAVLAWSRRERVEIGEGIQEVATPWLALGRWEL